MERQELENLLARFGPYQIYVLLLLILPSIFSALPLLSLTFTAYVPQYRCCIPELENCQNATKEFSIPEFTNATARQKWFYKADPNADSGYCFACFDGTTNGCSSNNSKPCGFGKVFDQSLFQNTLVQNLDWTCENAYKADLIRSMYIIGVIPSCFLYGYLSDRFGRYLLIVIPVMLQIPVYIAYGLTANFYLLCFLIMVFGGLQSTSYAVGYAGLMEVTQGKWRTVCGVFNQIFYTMAYFVLVAAAYWIRNIGLMRMVISLPILIMIPMIWLQPESIRWAYLNGRTKKFNKYVGWLKAMNKRNLVNPEENHKITQDSAVTKQQLDDENQAANEKESLRDLLQHRCLVFGSLGVLYTWFVVAMMYYGLSLNTNDLPGDMFLNFLLSGLVEVPGNLISIPLMEYAGRRQSLIIFYIIAGVTCLASGLLPKSGGWGTLVQTLATIGKLCTSGCFCVVYQVAAEVFPTSFRVTGLGACNFAAKTGALLAPQIHLLAFYVGSWLPIVVYGGFSLSAAVVTYFFIPETKGTKLPQTIQDSAELCDR